MKLNCNKCHEAVSMGHKFCGNCGAPVPVPQSEQAARANVTIGDIGNNEGNIVDNSHHGNVSKTINYNYNSSTSEQGIYKCPLCGRRNKAHDSFQCQMCRVDYLCERHLNVQLNCCDMCAKQPRKQRTTQYEVERQVPVSHTTHKVNTDLGYEGVMITVIKIVGDAGGSLGMSDAFDRFGQLPPGIDGKNLEWKLGRETGYLEPYSKVGRDLWVLSAKGWHVYNNMHEEWRSGGTKTTQIGYINRNNQKVLGTRGVTGNDHEQYSYKVECQNDGCGHCYGVNGSGIFERKCPKCQGGKDSIEY